MEAIDPSPRARIVELLQRRQEATVKELVELLGLAPVTVRHHLHRLERDGMIAYRERRRRLGRPDYAFYLTPQGQEAQPKGYHHLALMLVDAVKDIEEGALADLRGEEVLEALLRRAADDRAAALRQQISGQDLGSRLDSLVNVLNQEHFMAEASLAEGGYQLRCHACPYRAVAQECPVICALDQRLFEKVLPAKITRKTSIAAGDDYCLYEVSEPMSD